MVAQGQEGVALNGLNGYIQDRDHTMNGQFKVSIEGGKMQEKFLGRNSQRLTWRGKHNEVPVCSYFI